jgi:putative MATE family efflux protein
MPDARYLEQQPVARLLLAFSLPAIAGMLTGALYNVVDSIFVGRGVGLVALTAVTIALPIMLLLMAIGMLIGIGAGALTSISLGEKKVDEAEQILGVALTMAILFVAPAALIVFCFLDPLLAAFGATPQTLPYARDFVRIILMASVFLHIGFGLNNVVRAQGAPKTALATQALAFGLNAVLGYLFIFVFHWGIRGAALATAIGQGASAVWVIGYFLSGRGVLRLRLANLRPRGAVMARIAAIGVAPFAMQLGVSAVMVILNRLILGFGGDVAVAAFGVVNRIMMLALMPVVGIAQGAQPIIGYNFGAGKPRRVVEAVARSTAAATLLCVVAFGVAEIFADDVIRLFSRDPELIAIGRTALRLFVAMLPLIGAQIIGANYFQAVGKAYYAVVFSLLRQIIVLIPAAYLLSRLWGLTGVWVAAPVSDLAAALITVACVVVDLRAYLARNRSVPAAAQSAAPALDPVE